MPGLVRNRGVRVIRNDGPEDDIHDVRRCQAHVATLVEGIQLGRKMLTRDNLVVLEWLTERASSAAGGAGCERLCLKGLLGACPLVERPEDTEHFLGGGTETMEVEVCGSSLEVSRAGQIMLKVVNRFTRAEPGTPKLSDSDFKCLREHAASSGA